MWYQGYLVGCARVFILVHRWTWLNNWSDLRLVYWSYHQWQLPLPTGPQVKILLRPGWLCTWCHPSPLSGCSYLERFLLFIKATTRGLFTKGKLLGRKGFANKYLTFLTLLYIKSFYSVFKMSLYSWLHWPFHI